MNISKLSIISCIVAIMLIVSIPTVYKVIKNHQKHLVQASESKVIDAAKKCYYEEKCTNDVITLQELFDLNYLTENVSNPISKEVYNMESYVKVEDNNFSFFEKSE